MASLAAIVDGVTVEVCFLGCVCVAVPQVTGACATSWSAKGAVVRSSLDLALVLRGETQVKDPSSSLVLR